MTDSYAFPDGENDVVLAQHMQVDISYLTSILFLFVLLLGVGCVLRSSESSARCRTMPMSAQRSQYQVGLFSLAFHA